MKQRTLTNVMLLLWHLFRIFAILHGSFLDQLADLDSIATIVVPLLKVFSLALRTLQCNL